MTELEKAKAYDEAVERAKSAIKKCGDNKGRIAMIESIFPELAESEDEKIRKALIEFVDINTLSVDERHDRWIAWLEKQCYTKKDVDDAYLKGISDVKNELEKKGEQKPANTPKFKIGEWITIKK